MKKREKYQLQVTVWRDMGSFKTRRELERVALKYALTCQVRLFAVDYKRKIITSLPLPEPKRNKR